MTVSRRGALAAVALLLAAAALFLLWPRLPWRRADARSLLAELPPGDGLTVFVDARALRQTGILQRLAGEAGAEDDEYKRFVEATGFEYRRDLDAFVLRSDDGRRWIAAEARIDEAKLRRYFLAQGGRCVGPLCSMQGSTVERQISWVRLRRGRLGIAVSPDPLAAAAFGEKSQPPEWQLPDAPLWLYVPARMLKAPDGAPAWLALALESLRGARWLLWSATAEGTKILVRLEVACTGEEPARQIAARWEEVLKALKEAASAAGDTNSLPALLAEGRVRADKDRVLGEWRQDWKRLEQLLGQ